MNDKRYIAEWQKENTKIIPVMLNLDGDKDIIHKLDEKENKSGYIKDLIRKDIWGGKIMITDEFECILTAAMRYSLGRQTYMPSVVVGYITPLIPKLSDKFLYVTMRDIDERREREEKALGNPTVDKPVWDDFYKKIKIEYERRKNNE